MNSSRSSLLTLFALLSSSLFDTVFSSSDLRHANGLVVNKQDCGREYSLFPIGPSIDFYDITLKSLLQDPAEFSSIRSELPVHSKGQLESRQNTPQTYQGRIEHSTWDYYRGCPLALGQHIQSYQPLSTILNFINVQNERLSDFTIIPNRKGSPPKPNLSMCQHIFIYNDGKTVENMIKSIVDLLDRAYHVISAIHLQFNQSRNCDLTIIFKEELDHESLFYLNQDFVSIDRGFKQMPWKPYPWQY